MSLITEPRPSEDLTKPTRPGKRSLENYAACASLGLVFWAEHPRTNHMWAVDDNQTMHIVRIARKDGVAFHECHHSMLLEGGYNRYCDQRGTAKNWDIDESPEIFANLTAVPSAPTGKAPAKKSAPAKKAAAPKKAPARKAPAQVIPIQPAAKMVYTMTTEAAVAMIEHDPDYLDDIPDEPLAATLENTSVARKYGARIRAELKRRGLVLNKPKVKGA
jgi:hypothetical protein